MSKGCYTCRRRRIICDNGLPTCRKCRDAGKECLGYQKPLVWVKGGVASRGKMMGRSFGEGKMGNEDTQSHQEYSSPPASAVTSLPHNVESSVSTDHSQLLPVIPGSDNSESTLDASEDSVVAASHVPSPRVLVDPLLKDCSRLSRFYINHCMLFTAIDWHVHSSNSCSPSRQSTRILLGI